MRKLLIFTLYINLLFSKNVALLLGDFKTEGNSYMVKISNMLKRKGFEVIDNLKVDTSESLSRQSSKIKIHIFKKFKLKMEDKLIILGHGQGGLTALKLYYRCYKYVDIVGIFAISTPWQGASILNEREDILKDIINLINNFEKCKEYIAEVDLKKDIMIEYMELANYIKNIFQNSLDSPGIEDILPTSKNINSIDKHLNKVSIFNIISSYDNYIFDMQSIIKYKEQLDHMKKYVEKLSIINPIVLMDKVFENNTSDTNAAKEIIYASKFINNLISLLTKLIEFNKEDNNRVLTIREQQLPDILKKAQYDLKGGYNTFLVEGIHRSITENHTETVYDKDEVVEYIERSINDIVVSPKDNKD